MGQRRQTSVRKLAYPVQGVDSHFPVGHAHVHMAAADDLLSGQPLVLAFEAEIGLLRRDVATTSLGERMGPGRPYSVSRPLSGVDHAAAEVRQFLAQLLQRVTWRGGRLELGPLELGIDLFVLANLLVGSWYHVFGGRLERPRLGIDEQELLLDASGERILVCCHDACLRSLRRYRPPGRMDPGGGGAPSCWKEGQAVS